LDKLHNSARFRGWRTNAQFTARLYDPALQACVLNNMTAEATKIFNLSRFGLGVQIKGTRDSDRNMVNETELLLSGDLDAMAGLEDQMKRLGFHNNRQKFFFLNWLVHHTVNSLSIIGHLVYLIRHK
jgi:hypothetical protein